MRRLNPRCFPFEEEAFDALVAEALDHCASVSCYDTRVNSRIQCMTGRFEPDHVQTALPGLQSRDGLCSQEVCYFICAVAAGGCLLRQCQEDQRLLEQIGIR
jgi:hypothetical protein